jgi:hypothetical protein
MQSNGSILHRCQSYTSEFDNATFVQLFHTNAVIASTWGDLENAVYGRNVKQICSRLPPSAIHNQLIPSIILGSILFATRSIFMLPRVFVVNPLCPYAKGEADFLLPLAKDVNSSTP